MYKIKSKFIKNLSVSLILLILSIVLFALQHPSIFNINGFPVLSYIAFIPVFLLVRRVSFKTVWLYGLLYGVGSYCFYAYWLATFHPMGILVISLLYGLWLMIVFPLIKLATVLFPKKGWIVQWVFWCAYEYLKTKGFAGFQYGVTAYSHWQNLILLQSVDLIGLFGLNAVILFTSAWFSEVIHNVAFDFSDEISLKTKIFKSIKSHFISISVWCVCLLSVFIYGLISPIDYSAEEKMTVALVQQNSDPWRGGTEAYKRDLKVLTSLSDKALSENPDIQLVVWPETAFVPRITWHYKYRQDAERFNLVEDLLNYINKQNVPFIIGNDHAELGYTRQGTYDAIDYNTVVLFRPNENVIPPTPELYFKMHLVPFTEYFPFEKIFPKIYQLLLNGDTHMWEPGNNPVVFSVDNLRFGTPICFEDTFGYISALFVKNGANATVNISNDAWSKSLACQYQHLAMAIVHAVECRIPTIRATASGQTAIIDPNGKILSMAEPFTETYVIGDIPVFKSPKQTLYVLFGDYVGVGFSIFSACIFIFAFIRFVFRRIHSNSSK